MQKKKQKLYLLVSLVFFGLILSAGYANAGLKKIVAVSRFENKSSWSGQWRLDTGMADQLTDALVQSGNFVVLERETLSDVIGEQDLAASGRTSKSKSARTGKITSAQILIKGAITEFESSSSGSSSGVSFGGISLGGKKGNAHVAIIIRLIDTTTGEVLDSRRVEGKAKSGGFKLGVNYGGVGFGTGGFKKTPLGKATQIAIDTATRYISEGLKDLPFRGSVIKVKGTQVYISASKKTGATVGDVFTVYSAGEELIDPDTGELLGVEEEELGRIKIYKVMDKYSKAKPIGSVEGIERGAIIRSN